MSQYPAIRREQDKRVGDAERDRTCAELSRHYVEGRLSQDEFEERMSLSLDAVTRSDLRELLADMPRPVAFGVRPPQLAPVNNNPVLDALVAFVGISAFLCLGLLMMITLAAYTEGAFFTFLGALGAAVSLLAGQHIARRVRVH